MSTTNIEKPNNINNFNNTLIEFYSELISSFPEHKELLKKYINDIYNNMNDDKYTIQFMNSIKPYILELSKKNEEIFNQEIFLIENIDFNKIWNSNITFQTKNAIWKYFHSLYLLGNTIINKNNDINQIISCIKNNDDKSSDFNEHSQALVNIIKNLENNNSELSSDKSEDQSNETIPDLDNLFGNSKIGELASELANEISVDDLGLDSEINENPAKLLDSLMNGQNSTKLMDMIQTVGNKIQNKISSGQVNETQLLNEAQSMMGALGNNDLLSNMMNNMNKGNTKNTNKTKDRLKRKLNKKNMNKSNNI